MGHIKQTFFFGGGEVRNLGKHYSISFGPFEATQLIHITPCVLLTSVYSFLQPLYGSPYRHASVLPLMYGSLFSVLFEKLGEQFFLWGLDLEATQLYIYMHTSRK